MEALFTGGTRFEASRLGLLQEVSKGERLESNASVKFGIVGSGETTKIFCLHLAQNTGVWVSRGTA